MFENRIGRKYVILNPPLIEREIPIASNCKEPCKDIWKALPNCGMSFIRDSKNPLLQYELIPNYTTIFDGVWICTPAVTVKINSYGFRDYDNISIKKPSNTFRIIVLGDSISFGHALELNETYAKVLENMLNEKKGNKKYEVLNLAVPGYNMVQKVEFFIRTGLQFDPDLIILQYCGDDIINKTEKDEFYKKYLLNISELVKVNKSILIGLEEKIIKAYLTSLEKKPFHEVWKNVEIPLKELAKITTSKKIKVIIFIYPFPSGHESELRKIASTYGWNLLEYKELTNYDPSLLILNEKDKHPNAFAHKLIAKELYREIVEKIKI
jgi:lysophospholipase L1-like esterase